MSDEDWATAERDYAAGVPTSDIAARLGIGRSGVTSHMCHVGVQRPCRITPEAWRWAERAYAQALPVVPIADIAATLGVNRPGLLMHMHRRKIFRARRCLRPESAEIEAGRRYLANEPMERVAEALGLSQVAGAFRFVQATGLPPRTENRRRHSRGPTQPNPARLEAEARRERAEMARLEANKHLIVSARDKAWLAVPGGLRRCRCQECGALSASSVCPRGHTINQLPTEGAA